MDTETTKAWNWLASMLPANTTLNKSQLQALLTQTGGSMFVCGRTRDICSKHLGVNIYKVWTEAQKCE